MSDQWAHLPHHNEACATCGHPAEIHSDPGSPPPPPNSTWAKACRRFVRHQPPRAAYGELPGYSFRHSSECSKTLHGQSLAGCLKVRWNDGKRSWYDDCCEGELVPASVPAADGRMQLAGVDHRELLRKYIAHVHHERGWSGDPVDFTAEEKAELVRLASEGEESVDEIGAPHFPEADGPERY